MGERAGLTLGFSLAKSTLKFVPDLKFGNGRRGEKWRGEKQWEMGMI